jgi:F-type H+-transporting ATPase subunit b
MLRRVVTAAALVLLPGLALAEQTMPQMDFANPLTLDQIWWMVAILIALYVTLSRWGLPQVGSVLAHREAVISGDLEAARAAKGQADRMVAELNRLLNEARSSAQAEIAQAVNAAKAQAREEALKQQAALEAELEKSEAEIEKARAAALAAIKPVATETAAAILSKLTGAAPDAAALEPKIDRACAAIQMS